jgi:hypothetical protein
VPVLNPSRALSMESLGPHISMVSKKVDPFS